MRFHAGAIPDDPGFDPKQGGWLPIREPDPIRTQVLALPILLVVGAAVTGAILAWTPVSSDSLLLWVLVTALPMLVLHELVHALVHPGQGRTPSTIVGAWPSRGLLFAHYEGELSRERFLAILVAPFLVLTVVPLAVLVALRLDAPWLAGLALGNGVGACGDILGLILVGAQIPRGARVRNQGWRTYWRRVAHAVNPPAAAPE